MKPIQIITASGESGHATRFGNTRLTWIGHDDGSTFCQVIEYDHIRRLPITMKLSEELK